jgi:hemolysin activation/secretion protein
VALTTTEPGGNISSLGIQGDSQLYDLQGTYPLLRNRRYNLNLVAGLDALNSETDLLGIQTANDRVRSARAGVQSDFTDPLKGTNLFDLTGTQGLGILGATDDGPGRSRENGTHKFLKVALTATRIQQLPDLWSLMLSGTGQISRDPLLASEKFTVGGQPFGRAYDSGEITGDNGWAGMAELRYGGPVNNKFVQSYQAYGFIDYGKTITKAPAVGEMTMDSLSSAGLGMRFNLQWDISGYLEGDMPLNQSVASEGDKGSRLFFNLSKKF